MGLEGKPDYIKRSIIESAGGSKEATEQLRKAGRKGSEALKQKKQTQEARKNNAEKAVWDGLHKSEVDRLKNTYPEMDEDGNLVDEEWYYEKAAEYADAIIALRKRMQGYKS